MKGRMKRLFPFLAVPLIIISVIVLFAVVAISSVIPRQYATTDIADYGKYIGNHDNKTVQEFINSFFPEVIEDTFSNVHYSYRAQKNDAYAYEAYLSFTVENDALYNTTIEKYTVGLQQSEFRYDSAYTQYLLADTFEPGSFQTETSDVNIHYARIGKILCNPEKNEIIFIALGVYDGGIAQTDFLTVYFDRFQIDPLEYAKYTSNDSKTENIATFSVPTARQGTVFCLEDNGDEKRLSYHISESIVDPKYAPRLVASATA